MSSARVIGPLTIISTAAPPVDVPGPWYAQAGSPIPFTAATTTFMYSGRHPAITALSATFSAVIATARLSMKAT